MKRKKELRNVQKSWREWLNIAIGIRRKQETFYVEIGKSWETWEKSDLEKVVTFIWKKCDAIYMHFFH